MANDIPTWTGAEMALERVPRWVVRPQLLRVAPEIAAVITYGVFQRRGTRRLFHTTTTLNLISVTGSQPYRQGGD
jgi:hypothetical protein